MYQLTLTADERRAIDWIGNRYGTGDELYSALCKADWAPDDRDWDDQREITFTIPENVAWTIGEIIDREGCPCFSPDLTEKLTRFASAIV